MKSAAPSRSAGRVLVVEDERDVAELLRHNLARDGYEVVLAATGAETVPQVHDVHPDVVLLDIMVPRLEQDAETRAIPVIMVTGHVEEGDKVRGVGYRFRDPS